MNSLGLLSDPAVGNVIILIAAIIGVGGSYAIHRIRIRDRRSSTRRALKAELDSMIILDQWSDPDRDTGIPYHQIVPTVAYENNLKDIGHLSDEEIDYVTIFYSSAVELGDVMTAHREATIDSGNKSTRLDPARREREDVISSRLDMLSVERWQALQMVKKHLGEEYEPPEKMELPKSAGDTILRKHPLFQNKGDELISRGIFEESDDPELLQLTDSGEEYMSEVIEDNPGY